MQCSATIHFPDEVLFDHNRLVVALFLAVAIPLLTTGCTRTDESVTIADATESEIVAAIPSGNPSVEIRNIQVTKSATGANGFRWFEVNYQFVTGSHSEDTDLRIVIQHGSNTRSSAGSYLTNKWQDIRGSCLAPSDLADLTSEESQLIWPTLESIDVWLGVDDPDAPNQIRRVSQIVKVPLPNDTDAVPATKHPNHDVYEERARHIGNTVKIHEVKWIGPEGGFPAGIQFDMSQSSEGIDDLDVEMELDIENKTKGYTWNIKRVFSIDVMIQRMTFCDEEWHPSQAIDVDDALVARILSRRAIRWKDRRSEANELVYRNRITKSFNTRPLTEFD